MQNLNNAALRFVATRKSPALLLASWIFSNIAFYVYVFKYFNIMKAMNKTNMFPMHEKDLERMQDGKHVRYVKREGTFIVRMIPTKK